MAFIQNIKLKMKSGFLLWKNGFCKFETTIIFKFI